MYELPAWVSQRGRSGLSFGLAVATVFAIAWPTVVTSQPQPIVRPVVITVNKSRTITFDKPFNKNPPPSHQPTLPT